MCEPTTLMMLTMAMSAASAQQQHKAQKAKHLQNTKAAQAAQIDEQRQINIQKAQQDQSAAQEQIATDLDTRTMASRVEATDTGAIQNQNPIIQDIMRQGLESNTMVSQNLERGNVQSLEDFRGAKSTAQSRINSVARPSGAATGLKIASGIVSAGSQYKAGGFG